MAARPNSSTKRAMRAAPRQPRKARRAAFPGANRRKNRRKISTTIAAESYAYLQHLIGSGKAQNMAEAIDSVLEESLRANNRARNEKAARDYYENATIGEITDENEIAATLVASLPDPLFDE
jgi:hypothetical protein